MKTFVQFGAGNIGRSFIGRLFAEAGYEVVFVDVDRTLLALLNERRSYPVVVKQNERPDTTYLVQGIRAIDGRDAQAVIEAIVSADIVATSVGQRALQSIFPALADALVARKARACPPLDLIIAENMRSGAALFRQHLSALLPADFDLETQLGLVETSIGKMVPIMPLEALAADPLQLFTEPYDTLIVDRKAFRLALPSLNGLKAVNNIGAWVDRKLFLHNLSHAALAYLGYQADPTLIYCWQAMRIPSVVTAVREALAQSSAALAHAYPDDLTMSELADHSDDLLNRYRNRALGDTLHRVGRDLCRKLARDDRLVGACLLAARQDLPFTRIIPAIQAALQFSAPDEHGNVGAADRQFLDAVAERGGQAILSEVANLSPERPIDRRFLEACFGDKFSSSSQ